MIHILFRLFHDAELTEFLLNNLEDFLLVKLLWKTLDSGQGLATISLCTPQLVTSYIACKCRGRMNARWIRICM